MTIEDKGMPFHKSPFKFGNLFIMFKVVYPDQLNSVEKDKLLEAFKDMEGMNIKSNQVPKFEIREMKTLKPFQDSQRNSHHQGGNEAHDSDEENDDHLKGPAQCAQ